MVGMSGGVDSSVAAYMLKEKGYDVIGVTMKLIKENPLEIDERQDGCCSLSAVEDARRVCNMLDIPFYVLNFTEIFESKVIDYFVDEYFKGRTPNPCIACNKHIKFDALLKKARALGIDYIATGHYARIVYDFSIQRYLLKRSIDNRKDQTYALYDLTQEQLKSTLMPLGDYSKTEVREIAEKIGLKVANKPDSQEICFVTNNDYASFLDAKGKEKIRPGNFLDLDGNILGEHKGIVHYTIGQRKGLGIALGKPMFVAAIETDNNTVVLSDEKDIFRKELVADGLNFIPFERLERTLKVKTKIRYSAREVDSVLIPIHNNKVKVIFEEPQRAITPGQSAVFYDDDIVIGGGIIDFHS